MCNSIMAEGSLIAGSSVRCGPLIAPQHTPPSPLHCNPTTNEASSSSSTSTAANCVDDDDEPRTHAEGGAEKQKKKQKEEEEEEGRSSAQGQEGPAVAWLPPRRPSCERLAIRLSGDLLATYKTINELFYAEKRKKQAIQRKALSGKKKNNVRRYSSETEIEKEKQ